MKLIPLLVILHCMCNNTGLCIGLLISNNDSNVEMDLTAVNLTPVNSGLEQRIRGQFEQSKMIVIGFDDQVSFHLVITCTANCPVKWEFDNSQYLLESGPLPRITPKRSPPIGEGESQSQVFHLELEIEALIANQTSYGPRASLLTGKYTCGCKQSQGPGLGKHHFYGYFQSNNIKLFVNAASSLSVKIESTDSWIGLGCAIQIPDAKISLWKLISSEWARQKLGEQIRLDKSQGFVVSSQVLDPEKTYFKCEDESSGSMFVTTEVKQRGDVQNAFRSTPNLTLDEEKVLYHCCLQLEYPVVSFINCRNIDDCTFLSHVQFDKLLRAENCLGHIPLQGKCCSYRIPKSAGLLRCFNVASMPKPLISVSSIVEDGRTIAKNPEIHKRNQTQEHLILERIVSAFTFSNSTYWTLDLRNLSTIIVEGSHGFITKELDQVDTRDTILSGIKIPNNIDVEKASCFAPLVGSEEWRNESFLVEKLIGVSLDEGIGIYFAISVSFLILAVVIALVTRKFIKRPILSTIEMSKIQGSYETQTADPLIEEQLPNNGLLRACDEFCDILRMPYNKTLENPRSNVIYDKRSDKLGQGAFGEVFAGRLLVNGNVVDAAIKRILGSATKDKLKSMMAEIKIMSYIGPHLNVVSLMGVYTRNLRYGKILMAMELCARGSLNDFITKYREAFNQGLKPIFSSANLLQWSAEIAEGMHFLSSKKIIHVDLATRNVFLTDNFVVKIGDFGLSRRLYTKEIYIKRAAMRNYLPIYWMSLESLQDLSFSVSSDIWSYGVTIWEMFSLCDEPYKGKGGRLPISEELVLFLSSSFRLGKPKYATNKIYDIMLQCWQECPLSRPPFASLKHFFMEEASNLTTHINPLVVIDNE